MEERKRSVEQEEVGQFSGDDEHGWSHDLDDPTDEAQRATGKAFDPSQAGEPGSGRTVSEAEREGVSSTDTTGQTPLGVGESTRRGGEETARTGDEAGRTTLGTQGKSQRPVGTSSEEASTGVDPRGDAVDESSNVQTGDQGG